MGISNTVLWLAVFFHVQAGVISKVNNIDELNKGFCHKEIRTVSVSFGCQVRSVIVKVQNSDNQLNSCTLTANKESVVRCHYGSYNRTDKVLKYNFTFDHQQNAEQLMWINYTCDNGGNFSDHIRLYPCLSGFTVSGHHNGTHANITCKHNHFKMSNGIRIIANTTGNDVERCWWSGTLKETLCIEQSRGHVNGVEGYITKHTDGTIYQCDMDGQKIQVDVKIEEMDPEKGTTTSNRVNPGVPGRTDGNRAPNKGSCLIPTTRELLSWLFVAILLRGILST